MMRVPSPSHPFPVSTVSGGAVTLANEATYPKTVDVTTGGAGVTVLAANASRKPGSYIFNLSDTELEFNYDTTLTPGSSGLVGPGQVLKLYEGNYIYPGAVRMYQASGSTKKVWVASFI